MILGAGCPLRMPICKYRSSYGFRVKVLRGFGVGCSSKGSGVSDLEDKSPRRHFLITCSIRAPERPKRQHDAHALGKT